MTWLTMWSGEVTPFACPIFPRQTYPPNLKYLQFAYVFIMWTNLKRHFHIIFLCEGCLSNSKTFHIDAYIKLFISMHMVCPKMGFKIWSPKIGSRIILFCFNMYHFGNLKYINVTLTCFKFKKAYIKSH